MRKLLFAFCVLLLAQSCGKKVYLTTTHTIYDTTSIVVHDRIVDTFIDKDTFSQSIYIDCDSNRKPFVRGSGTINGKRGSLSSSLNGNTLGISGTCNELYIKLAYQDSIIRRLRNEKEVVKEVKIVERNFWYYLKMIGWHLMYLPAFILIYELLKPFIKKLNPFN